jgi:hypothetical protein
LIRPLGVIVGVRNLDFAKIEKRKRERKRRERRERKSITI